MWDSNLRDGLSGSARGQIQSPTHGFSWDLNTEMSRPVFYIRIYIGILIN